MKTEFKLLNGNLMPAVGFGTFRIENNDDAAAAVKSAIQAGYRHIDTADIYGNEEGVGRGIKESGVDRSEIFLTTKVWNERLRKGDVRKAAEQSLERLGTDYVDMLLVHWPTGNYMEYWKTFEEMNREGLAKNIGVSNFTVDMLTAFLPNCSVLPAVNQVELHPRLTQKKLLEFCGSKGIVLTAWSGFMVGDLLKDEGLLSIAGRYGKTAAQVILRWNFQNGIINIPKSVNPNRQKENIDIFDFELSREDMAAIDSMNRDQRCGPDPDNFDF